MKPVMYVFMGGQGSGKGTFAKMMLQKQEYEYIEVGELLRNTPKKSQIFQKISKGLLICDEDLFPFITPYLDSNCKDIILDGFPRTLSQAQWLVNNYANKFDIRILYLDISEETMLRHIQKRIAEGGQRSDDANTKAVHKRIETFKNVTIPAIEWLSKESQVTFYDIKLPSDDINTNFEYINNNYIK